MNILFYPNWLTPSLWTITRLTRKKKLKKRNHSLAYFVKLKNYCNTFLFR